MSSTSVEVPAHFHLLYFILFYFFTPDSLSLILSSSTHLFFYPCLLSIHFGTGAFFFFTLLFEVSFAFTHQYPKRSSAPLTVLHTKIKIPFHPYFIVPLHHFAYIIYTYLSVDCDVSLTSTLSFLVIVLILNT